jgi:hypothetical protein
MRIKLSICAAFIAGAILGVVGTQLAPRIASMANAPLYLPIATPTAEVPRFRGVPLGISPFKQYLPLCPEGLRHLSSADNANTTCWWPTDPADPTSLAYIFFVDNLDDTLGRTAKGMLSNWALGIIEFDCQLDKFAKIYALFHAKYGDPESKEEPWQSSGGLKTTAHIHRWTWNTLTIVLTGPAEDIDHAKVLITTQDFIDESEQLRANDLKKGIGDL